MKLVVVLPLTSVEKIWIHLLYMLLPQEELGNCVIRLLYGDLFSAEFISKYDSPQRIVSSLLSFFSALTQIRALGFIFNFLSVSTVLMFMCLYSSLNI